MFLTVRQRLLLGLFVTAVISGLFWWGLGKHPLLPDANLYAQLGLICGFFSALTWGLSVLGSYMWNSWFNFFAAALAALSLGYVTPYPF